MFCGQGNQKVQWLADVALHRYEHFHNSDPGLAKGMRFEDGDFLDMQLPINETDKLQQLDSMESVHVWVVLKEDLALLEAERARK